MVWNVYLSGEIHSDWRTQIMQQSQELDLPINFSSAVIDHQASDAAGDMLGEESNAYWRDHKSAKVNAIRTRKLLSECDLAIIRFGPQYKQWNAAFEAGYCCALDIPYITLHDEPLVHPLKEVDAGALAWGKSVNEVLAVLQYVVRDA
ncbi:YtoQ family protein [Alteromonadaceae bacterium Bs31]|nr:YtoQ family protein [Alteromonadaceae bacterium Bs31]